MAALKPVKLSKERPITPFEHISFMWDRACGLAVVHGWSYTRISPVWSVGKITHWRVGR